MSEGLRLGIVSRTATYWPIYVASSEGLFAAEELDVRVVELGSTSAGVDALLAGRIDVAATCPDALIGAVDGGAPLAIAGGLVDRVPASIVARRGVTGVRELRGRRIGVTDPRGSVSRYLRAALRRAGLADGDYDAVVVGTTPAQTVALRRGTIDAAMLTYPFDRAATADGAARGLIDVAAALGPVAFTTLNVRRGATREAWWPRLRSALAAASQMLGTDEAHVSLARATGLARDLVSDAYGRCVRSRVFAEDGVVARSGLDALLALLREDGANPAALESYLERDPAVGVPHGTSDMV